MEEKKAEITLEEMANVTGGRQNSNTTQSTGLFTCPRCQQKFSTQEILDDHMRTHVKKREFYA